MILQYSQSGSSPESLPKNEVAPPARQKSSE
jgi:hypothetical protein